jgi:hypothetical protein
VIILVAVMGVVLFIILALIVQSSFYEEPVKVVEEGGRDVTDTGLDAPDPDLSDEPLAPVRTERELFCLDFLQAVADNDVDGIQGMFNFSVYYRVNKSDEDPHWDDLPDLDQIMKKQAYTQALTDDSAGGGGFVRVSEILFTKELAWDGTEGEVEVGLKNKNNGREQERNFKVKRFGSYMMIYDYAVGEEHGGDLAVQEEAPKTLDQKYKRRVSPVGEIREQAFTPDTDEGTAAEIRMLVDDLLGENRARSRDSRTRLLDYGKKSIPGILNGMVGLDMTREEDVAKANKCVSLMRTLTGRNFRFVPGFVHESELESMAADLNLAIGRWFGWWDRNKDSWTGRDLEKEQEGMDDW